MPWYADHICDEPEKCWLCDGYIIEKPTVITVECKTPGGEPCKPYDVPVHHGCYMDIDA
jgi:hypothetical protein